MIQPLLPTTLTPLTHVARALCERRAGVLAMVCVRDRSPSVEVGEFLWFDGSANSAGTLTNPALVTAVATDASQVAKTGRSILRPYTEQGDGCMQVFIEAVCPPRSLLICGAGEDAIPLARLGKELGWRVRMVDGRRAYATRRRFPEVDELVVCPPREFSARSNIEAGEAIVLMTHNYQHDQEFLRAALASPVAYVGILGPRRRTERLLSEAGEFHGSPSGRRRAYPRTGGFGHRSRGTRVNRACHRGGDRSGCRTLPRRAAQIPGGSFARRSGEASMSTVRDARR